jgi:hypothetical protein
MREGEYLGNSLTHRTTKTFLKSNLNGVSLIMRIKIEKKKLPLNLTFKCDGTAITGENTIVCPRLDLYSKAANKKKCLLSCCPGRDWYLVDLITDICCFTLNDISSDLS